MYILWLLNYRRNVWPTGGRASLLAFTSVALPSNAPAIPREPLNTVTVQQVATQAKTPQFPGAAVCPDLATTCQCTNANFRSDFLSCVQGECQAAELDNAQQFVASLCGTVSLTAKSTTTVPFLPTNANADVHEPSHTSSSASNTSQETGSPNTGSTQTVDRNGGPAGAIAASVVIVVLIVVLVIFLWWWIRRRRQRIRGRRFPAPFLESASPVQRVVRSPSIIKVAAATDVEMQAGVAGTTMAQGVALDETQPEKGAPARTHNPRLINFSDVPAEENAAQASNAQDAAHTEEAVTVRLRRVEAQLAALLTPAVESPEELPPKETIENIRNEDWITKRRTSGVKSPWTQFEKEGMRNGSRQRNARQRVTEQDQ
ncbi:hypothetical protein B0H13DRAFT_2271443 [Mycena leptocephala]|nr:hypothetical protein B0H13DRAFT_2271443 [Mycena leptocephala]